MQYISQSQATPQKIAKSDTVSVKNDQSCSVLFCLPGSDWDSFGTD